MGRVKHVRVKETLVKDQDVNEAYKELLKSTVRK